GRTLWLLRAALVAGEAVEVVLRGEQLPDLEVRLAERGSLDVHERHADAVEGGEVADHRVRFRVGEMERGHAEPEPGADGDRRLDEVEEPVGLHLLPLAHEDRRGERQLVLIEAADVASRSLDDVAAGAVVARDEATTGDDA